MRMSTVFSGEKPGALAARPGPAALRRTRGSPWTRSPAAHSRLALGPHDPAAWSAVSAYLLSALLNWSSAQAYAVGATLDQYFQLWLSPVSRW